MISKNTMVHVGSPESKPGAGGRTYQQIDVIYKDDKGQTRNKSLRSFVNPEIFKQAQDFKEGDVFYTDTQKDDAGFWQWLQLSSEPIGGAPAATGGGASKAGTGGQRGSTYETPQERGRKQVLIVRQSSMSQALSHVGAEGTFSKAAKLAEQIESWVLRGYVVNDDDTIQRQDSADEDIPQ